jgi:hypothetical protein
MPSPSRPLAAVLLVLGAVIASFGAVSVIHGGHLDIPVGAHLVMGIALLFVGGIVLGRAP